MPENSATVARSLAAARAAAASLVEQCVDHAVAELQAAEGRAMAAERQQLADAWRALLSRRASWIHRFPSLLHAGFGEDADRGARHAPDGDPAVSSSFLDLALVDDTEIDSKIESSRLAQQLTSSLERPLADLDGLMSSALGLAVVTPERNPLRPAVYARALRKMMEESPNEPGWTALWLRAMAQPLTRQLEVLYRAQVESLTQAHVHAADYRLVTAPSKGVRPASTHAPAVAGAAAGLNGTPGVPVAPGAADMPVHTMAPIAGSAAAQADAAWGTALARGLADAPAQALPGAHLQQFLLRGDPQAQRPVAPGFLAQARAALRALEAQSTGPAYDPHAARGQMHVPAVDRTPRHVDADSPLPPETWGAFAEPRERALVRGRLQTEARETGQVLGLEVVRRLVNRVAEDPRLLAPVREAIVGLEPSLSRLAMVAPRFFSDEEHPGRLLVEKVAERSFKFNDEFSVEFQGFFHGVAQSFQRLNEVDDLASPEPFRQALGALQAGWHAQDAMDEEAQQEVLQAVQLAERRQQEAERIASELRLREDLERAPEVVREFVLGTWALVIAHARLEHPHAVDPGGHLSVLGDLLWSVDRDQALHDPARAFEVIPRVLLGLRAGLDALGQTPAETDNFFRQLEILHRPVMKLRARQRNRQLAPPEPVRIADDSEASGLHDEHPWMAPEELRAAGFEDTVPSGFAQLVPGIRAAPQAPVLLADHEAEDLLMQLEPGAWVDLYSRQQWRRAKLVWAAAKGTFFMFVSHGGQPHSMTRRSLHRLLKQRLLRPVVADAVVPLALERLAEPSMPMPLAA